MGASMRTLVDDARVLGAMLRGLPRRSSHAESLIGFYAPQASRYDAFRERLLHGRDRLVSLLPSTPGSFLVELGGGTGRNLEFFGDRLAAYGRVEVVDLCAPLLQHAAERARRWPHVHVVAADACTYVPPAPVDCVYFSYALTMIPDWRQAIDNALQMLRPGGTLGVVDFYVSERDPVPGLARHGWATRALCPLWFRHDGVHLSPDHLPYLRRRLVVTTLEERRAPLPYVPGVTAPYYVLVGRRR